MRSLPDHLGTHGCINYTFLNSLKPADILQNSYLAHFLSMFCYINWIGTCYNDTTGWLFDIGSGNGLVPLGNKPLPDPVLSKFMTSFEVTQPQWVNLLSPGNTLTLWGLLMQILMAVQACGDSSAIAIELPQSCAKPRDVIMLTSAVTIVAA